MLLMNSVANKSDIGRISTFQMKLKYTFSHITNAIQKGPGNCAALAILQGIGVYKSLGCVTAYLHDGCEICLANMANKAGQMT